jgi:hypothetical protein
MIGSSLPLCYPQIAVPDLLYHRALCFISPLTKHIRLVGVGAFSGSFCGLKWVPSKWRCLVPPGCRLAKPRRNPPVPRGAYPHPQGATQGCSLAPPARAGDAIPLGQSTLGDGDADR